MTNEAPSQASRLGGMDRRGLLAGGSALALAMGLPFDLLRARAPAASYSRVRPGQQGWPDQQAWAELGRAVGGRLVEVQSPLDACVADPGRADCAALFRSLRNPYFIGDDVALTQTLGWIDAWTSRPSAYAVVADNADDVAAAVNFARERRLRLVVKGGGHSYLGTSNAPDSLLIWTRKMDAIELHDAFVGEGCEGKIEPLPAVSVGAGAMWMRVYNAVTTKGGRYVQGGGCATVGVAGLVQSGGFGSFSKAYGTAAGSLLEAEIVTADGVRRIANACTHPDLFWAIKGGGGGSFGTVTRLTLRTHDLPDYFGAAMAVIEAKSDASYRRLVTEIMRFYSEKLFNPHWGEQIRFGPGNRIGIQMVFQGLTEDEARAVWKPFLDHVQETADYALAKEPMIMAVPARRFWDPSLMGTLPGITMSDDRPGAPKDNIFWSGDAGQVGQVLTGFHSAWLPSGLLDPNRLEQLVDALVSAARQWSMELHFNKALGGSAPDARARSADTATNPAMLDAFALAMMGGERPPAYPGIPGHEPDVAGGRRDAATINKAFEPIARLMPAPASYVSESNYFHADWQAAYWGGQYQRLAAIKRRYDPEGLFFAYHGVGSESWSVDGFDRV